MSNLSSLIRLHRWQLDEKRRAYAELEALRTRLTGELARLESDLARERELAGASELPPIGFAAFVAAVLARRARMLETIRQVEQQIAEAGEEIAAAFQELKRFEIAEEERVKRTAARRRRAESAKFDEVAVLRHARAAPAE